MPLLEVSALLRLPLTGIYTSLCLWNYRKIFPVGQLDDLLNLAVLFTFTGTVDEEWFYMVSVAIEARGAKIISHLLEGSFLSACIKSVIRTYSITTSGLSWREAKTWQMLDYQRECGIMMALDIGSITSTAAAAMRRARLFIFLTPEIATSIDAP
ncbi:indoleamine 2,3-dioxygenase [Aspergillus udagawae]|uniref:Indoleamine 2,3-dioxygenase n=1 Tax=Aspergillus udagawae TaxID=91492 RepID=A0A8H3S562_9EURO|nr:indoleamine 2,3-dioxygenase [Aspergillus udagawae]